MYAVTLRRDGTAEYEGQAYVTVLGSYTATVDSATFARLAGYLVRRGFFGLEGHYSVGVTDQPSTVTTAFFDGDSLVVDRYGGGGPNVLSEMEHAIDSVAARLKWVARP